MVKHYLPLKTEHTLQASHPVNQSAPSPWSHALLHSSQSQQMMRTASEVCPPPHLSSSSSTIDDLLFTPRVVMEWLIIAGSFAYSCTCLEAELISDFFFLPQGRGSMLRSGWWLVDLRAKHLTLALLIKLLQLSSVLIEPLSVFSSSARVYPPPLSPAPQTHLTDRAPQPIWLILPTSNSFNSCAAVLALGLQTRTDGGMNSLTWPYPKNVPFSRSLPFPKSMAANAQLQLALILPLR